MDYKPKFISNYVDQRDFNLDNPDSKINFNFIKLNSNKYHFHKYLVYFKIANQGFAMDCL
jgi:hypothetical protein